MSKLHILFLCHVSLFITMFFANFTVRADAISDGEKGIEAFRQGKLISAMQLLQQSAEQHYAPAQVTLAYIMDQSEQDKQAFYWFQKAATQDYPAGQFGLGNMYAKGEGVEKNPLQAGSWIEKSAMQKHVPAMRAFAFALEQGELGFKQNQQSATLWYQSAAEAGDEVSIQRLASAYRHNELGLEIDVKQALYWENKINQKQGSKQ